jgi:hypothetical protein
MDSDQGRGGSRGGGSPAAGKAAAGSATVAPVAGRPGGSNFKSEALTALAGSACRPGRWRTRDSDPYIGTPAGAAAGFKLQDIRGSDPGLPGTLPVPGPTRTRDPLRPTVSDAAVAHCHAVTGPGVPLVH